MAESVRQQKVCQAILRSLSTILLAEYGGSPIASAVVNRVKVTPDLRTATVYYTIMGKESREKLKSAFEEETKRIRFRLAKAISHIKFMPEIKFVYDDHAEEALRIEKLLDTISQERDENS